MRDWKQFEQDLEEWQAHPVTEALKGAVGKVCQRRKDQLCQRYLAGRAASEPERIAVLMIEQWAEDFFESSAEDIRAAIEEEDD